MLIGIDIRSATGQKLGIGNYTYNLVKALSKIDAENKYILYARDVCKKSDFVEGSSDNFTLKVFRYPVILWHLRVLFDILLEKLETYHTSSFILPVLLPKNRCVIFIPDVTAYTFSKYHTLKVRLLMKLSTFAVRKARGVLTISFNSKKDIVSVFRLSDNFVTVTPLAAAEHFKRIDDRFFLDQVRARYNLPDKFILFVGSIEPRKNLIFLINVFDAIKDRMPHKLVIAGAKGWLNSGIFNAIKAKHLEKDIVFTGYVSDNDLAAIYNLADLFVYPSFYEGFGLPILEAMACVTPVITSNTSSMPEAAGEAAIMLDPYDKSGIWEKKICNVLADTSLRDKMVLDGLAQAKKFSWNETACRTLEAYKCV